jgi:hypothetical protein
LCYIPILLQQATTITTLLVQMKWHLLFPPYYILLQVLFTCKLHLPRVCLFHLIYMLPLISLCSHHVKCLFPWILLRHHSCMHPNIILLAYDCLLLSSPILSHSQSRTLTLHALVIASLALFQSLPITTSHYYIVFGTSPTTFILCFPTHHLQWILILHGVCLSHYYLPFHFNAHDIHGTIDSSQLTNGICQVLLHYDPLCCILAIIPSGICSIVSPHRHVIFLYHLRNHSDDDGITQFTLESLGS